MRDEHGSRWWSRRFRYLPQQPGYNKRLRKLAGTVNWLIGMLARDTSVWTDDVWVVDSTPVECGRPPPSFGSAGARSPSCFAGPRYLSPRLQGRSRESGVESAGGSAPKPPGSGLQDRHVGRAH